MITRRATRRHFLFRPDEDGTSQRLYWYATAVVAEKFGIELHAVQVLSTHIHEVLTDTRGELPAFLRERNRLLANALKQHRGWPEEVFQRAPANYVELLGVDALLKQIGYTLANCVEAGLVKHPGKWPGVTVSADDIGLHVVEVERPRVYFDPKNRKWPARARLPITMPRELKEAYAERAPAVLRAAVDAAIARARSLAREAGYTVGAVAQLLSVPFSERATSAEPTGQSEPTFATGGNRSRAEEAWRELSAFRELYRKALAALRAGQRYAFPRGTWRWCKELLPPSPLEQPSAPTDASQRSSSSVAAAALGCLPTPTVLLTAGTTG
ncbi:MAG: transposase [Myxococcales bacterium]|nr:transposase [Myxococcales bacterium]